MIMIRPIVLKKLNEEIEYNQWMAVRYGDKSLHFFEKYKESRDIHDLTLAKLYRDLMCRRFDYWMELRKKRDKIKQKPFIFWE